VGIALQEPKESQSHRIITYLNNKYMSSGLKKVYLLLG